MTKIFITIALIAFQFSLMAQTTKSRLNVIEDRMALKELVDRFSILADQKNTEAHTLLFTENATVETYMNGNNVGTIKGRKDIGNAFAAFLNKFSIVYHLNGQQIVEINQNNATGVSYCLVTLIGEEDGKKMKTTFGIHYQDEYIKENNHWLITKRKSMFDWQEKTELH